ncbi:MAG: DUF2164 domain-containing protein [Hydrogenophaga sp.]|nr:DUF2164 domain-containing protein [Hydrogenophaga sp.]
MTELSKDARKVAIASIQRYCKEELDFPIGNLRAGGLLDFFTTEIGSIIYNHALHDMQESLLARTDDAVSELRIEELSYWKRTSPPKN